MLEEKYMDRNKFMDFFHVSKIAKFFDKNVKSSTYYPTYYLYLRNHFPLTFCPEPFFLVGSLLINGVTLKKTAHNHKSRVTLIKNRVRFILVERLEENGLSDKNKVSHFEKKGLGELFSQTFFFLEILSLQASVMEGVHLVV